MAYDKPVYLNPGPTQLTDCEGDGTRLLATVKMFTTNFHLSFIRVKTDGEGCQSAYCPSCQEELEDVFRLYDARAFDTVEVPGFEGEFVAYMHPYEA